MASNLQELGVPTSMPLIFFDNQSVVALAHNPVLHARTKHMEIDLFLEREKILSNKLSVVHIPAQDQWADLLTKPLSPTSFQFIRDKLKVLELSQAHPP